MVSYYQWPYAPSELVEPTPQSLHPAMDNTTQMNNVHHRLWSKRQHCCAFSMHSPCCCWFHSTIETGGHCLIVDDDHDVLRLQVRAIDLYYLHHRFHSCTGKTSMKYHHWYGWQIPTYHCLVLFLIRGATLDLGSFDSIDICCSWIQAASSWSSQDSNWGSRFEGSILVSSRRNYPLLSRKQGK